MASVAIDVVSARSFMQATLQVLLTFDGLHLLDTA